MREGGRERDGGGGILQATEEACDHVSRIAENNLDIDVISGFSDDWQIAILSQIDPHLFRADIYSIIRTAGIGDEHS